MFFRTRKEYLKISRTKFSESISGRSFVSGKENPAQEGRSSGWAVAWNSVSLSELPLSVRPGMKSERRGRCRSQSDNPVGCHQPGGERGTVSKRDNVLQRVVHCYFISFFSYFRLFIFPSLPLRCVFPL